MLGRIGAIGFSCMLASSCGPRVADYYSLKDETKDLAIEVVGEPSVAEDGDVKTLTLDVKFINNGSAIDHTVLSKVFLVPEKDYGPTQVKLA